MNIIINADDFGISENVNNVIIKMHQKGVLTSATIMAQGNAFDHAVSLAKENPKLGIGVHLCLDGPYNMDNNYKSLINKDTGKFYSQSSIKKRLMLFRVIESEIEKEYSLQIQKVLDSNIHISHLDHHHHIHLYLPALQAMIKAAKKFKIGSIRTQKLLSYNKKSLVNTILRSFHHKIISDNFKCADAYLESKIRSEAEFELNYQRLENLFNMKYNTVEIVLHPVNDHDPETVFFSSKRTEDLLNKVKLINYNHLNKNVPLVRPTEETERA